MVDEISEVETVELVEEKESVVVVVTFDILVWLEVVEAVL